MFFIKRIGNDELEMDIKLLADKSCLWWFRYPLDLGDLNFVVVVRAHTPSKQGLEVGICWHIVVLVFCWFLASSKVVWLLLVHFVGVLPGTRVILGGDFSMSWVVVRVNYSWCWHITWSCFGQKIEKALKLGLFGGLSWWFCDWKWWLVYDLGGWSNGGSCLGDFGWKRMRFKSCFSRLFGGFLGMEKRRGRGSPGWREEGWLWVFMSAVWREKRVQTLEIKTWSSPEKMIGGNFGSYSLENIIGQKVSWSFSCLLFKNYPPHFDFDLIVI